jgi:hypothetical protein
MKLPLQLRELELVDDRFEEGNGGGNGGGEEGGFSGVALLGKSGGFSLRGFAMSDGCGCVCLVSGAGGRKVNESSERAAAAEKRLLGGGALSLIHDAAIRGAARRLNSGAAPEVEEFAIARRSGATRSSFPLSRRKNHAFHDPSRVIASVADRTQLDRKHTIPHSERLRDFLLCHCACPTTQMQENCNARKLQENWIAG